MIKYESSAKDEIHTMDFSSPFAADDIKMGSFSYQSDMYSIGKIILYITNNKNINQQKQRDTTMFYKYNEFQKIYDIFTTSNFSDLENRMFVFYTFFYERFMNSFIQNDPTIKNMNFLLLSDLQYADDLNKEIQQCIDAANQNDEDAQYALGTLYLEGKYVEKNINKSLHYFLLAANQNHEGAQYDLGIIYLKGSYIERDINKSIFYFTLAANKNMPEAQFMLGYLYYEGEYVERDIKKSIHYLSLSANKNFPAAQFLLGFIFYEGKYVKFDINKAIQYFSLSANQNYSDSQYYLGIIYSKDKYSKKDINKSLHFFTLASYQNHKSAQYFLGFFYLLYFLDIKKGVYFLMQSAKNGNIVSNFVVGYFFHEGKYINQDINKAIKYYKEASSFDYQYSKNNLGVIFKNGFSNEILKNIGNAISYLKEAVKKYNDKISMYNLSNIYIYEFKTDKKIDKAIGLLIKSSNQEFYPALNLLCLALIIKHGKNFKNIEQELLQKIEKKYNFTSKIYQIIVYNNLYNEYYYNKFYQYHKEIDFVYDYLNNPIILNKEMLAKQKAKRNYDITSSFYEGYGIR